MDVSLSADKFAPVALERVMPYATERMRQRMETLPFRPTHAIIALFEGRVGIGEKGGDYSVEEETLKNDCERLRNEFPGHRFHPSGNAWPLPAVQAARLAGLGVMGLNGLLFAPGLGFALTIGAVLTDMPLPDGKDGGYCPLCGECVKKCPTQAITYAGGMRQFEREKCLSYLRQRADMPLEREGYYGCDICQDVCPMQKPG
jgi:epoxyqueuosine reductase QueG